jgi:predicted SnoaL-like aldol condensation-catalyzing enzyme
MKRRIWGATVALIGIGSACAANMNMTPILSTGAKSTQEQDEASNLLALQFVREFFNHGTMNASQAAEAFLAPDFQNHDPDEPSGSKGFANWVNRNRKAELKPTPEPLRLLVMSDGDLTLFVYPNRNADDPASTLGSNLFSHKDGKLTAWYYSGPQAGQGGPPAAPPPPAAGTTAAAPAAPPAPPPPRDYSKMYQGYTASNGSVVIMNAGASSAAERAANKKLVLNFWNDFFVHKKASAAKALSPALTNHVPGQPSGAEFAAYATRNPFNVTAQKLDDVLFTIAQGDLVAIGFPFPVNGDPGAHYLTNLVRVKEGKIVDWWFSGMVAPYAKAPPGGIPDGKYVRVAN